MRKRLCLLLLVPFFGKAQDISKNADALLTAYHQQGKFTGTVLIAKQGKVLFEKGYGYADQENKVPNTPTTEFRVGSVTKQFTATLIMQLQEQKKLSVKDPLRKYIPDYPKGDSILIENLLNHTSGIQSITSMKAYYDQWMKEPATLEQTISHFKDQPLRFSPGSKYEYSNSNYILLSYIAEKVSGKPFTDLLRTQILKKVQMKQSGLDATNRTAKQKAKGYQLTPENEYTPARFVEMSVLSGAGAMYSTVRDLYKWDRKLYGNTIVSETSKKQLFTPGKGHYGFGWEIDTVKGRVQISHAGQTDGFQANIIRYPEQDICIIYLSNYMDSKGPQISKALTAIAFNEPFEIPKARKPITLNESVYKAYAGQYQMEKGPVLSIVYEDGHLKGKLGEQPYFEILAESETNFFIKGMDGDVVFTKNEANEVTGVNLTNGKTISFKRIGENK